jgi:hypothetical protein
MAYAATIATARNDTIEAAMRSPAVTLTSLS